MRDGNNITSTVTDIQQDFNNAPNGEKKAARFNRPVSIHIHSIRNRLTDPDGGCAKYFIDALVSAGVLQDDRPEEIHGITYSQEKQQGVETTIITIEEVP